jgi:hypothetical protein
MFAKDMELPTCKHPATAKLQRQAMLKKGNNQTAIAALIDIRGTSPTGTFSDFRLRRAITIR